MKNKNGYMPSLRKQTLYKDTWERLQRETHFSNRQMFECFPDLYKMMELEERKNITISVSNYMRIGRYQRRKIGL